MENIVNQTLAEIGTALRDHGVDMDSWRTDAIHKILILALNRAFQEGRSAGLREVMHVLTTGAKPYYAPEP